MNLFKRNKGVHTYQQETSRLRLKLRLKSLGWTLFYVFILCLYWRKGELNDTQLWLRVIITFVSGCMIMYEWHEFRKEAIELYRKRKG